MKFRLVRGGGEEGMRGMKVEQKNRFLAEKCSRQRVYKAFSSLFSHTNKIFTVNLNLILNNNNNMTS